MNRREFIRIIAVATAFASGGFLPLLAAEGKKKAKMAGKKAAREGGSTNCFTEPPAIEPVTGYLDGFVPVQSGSMAGDFVATYALVEYKSAVAKSKNIVAGSLELQSVKATVTSIETRQKNNVVKNVLQCQGELNTVKSWSLESSIAGMPDIAFKENGTWDGTVMTVKSKSWTQTHPTSLQLIGRWALPQLLASGKIKNKPLRFDMLDDSILRLDQTLKFCGEIEIPTKKGAAKLDCYSQTGYGIMPTHYLVDGGGRVQLITQETVNWALTELR